MTSRRRPPESRVFLASRSTIYLDDACRFSRDRWTYEKEISMMRGRIGDPKVSTLISGNRGLFRSPSRRRRWTPSASFAVESSLSYNMIEQTTRAEAASGPDGDDNGPGSEPPPHNRFRCVLTFVTSRRRPPAAVGKPSFACFSVDYLPHDVWRPDEPTNLRERNLPDATSYERSEDIGPNRRNPRNQVVRLASAKTDSFDIILPSQQFWPRK